MKLLLDTQAPGSVPRASSSDGVLRSTRSRAARTWLCALAGASVLSAATTVASTAAAQPPPEPPTPAPAPAPAPTDPAAPPAAPPADPNAPPKKADGDPVDPNAPPTPPPPGAPTQPPAATPAPTFVPPVITPVQYGPPADKKTDAPKKAPPKPLPWRGWNFIWSHQLTTTVVGIGQDLQSNTGEAYNWNFSTSPGWFLVDESRHRLRAFVNFNADYELTSSDFTTDRNEFLFGDIGLGATYTGTMLSLGGGSADASGAAAKLNPALAGSGDFLTFGIISANLRFPTSKFSQGAGNHLRTNVIVALRQVFKLLGNNAPGLNNLTVTLSESWRHSFNSATTPVNANVRIPRQSATGGSFDSDQFSSFALEENALTHGLDFILPLIGDLTAFASLSYTNSFPHQFAGSDCEANTLTGCVRADRMDDRVSMRVNTFFDVSLYYSIVPEVSLGLGYTNFVFGGMRPDGRRRDFGYSPDAYFHGDLLISLDAIYKRIDKASQKKAAQSNIEAYRAQ